MTLFTVLFLLHLSNSTFGAGPGSPDWDSLLSSPIFENLSPSHSPHSSDHLHATTNIAGSDGDRVGPRASDTPSNSQSSSQTFQRNEIPTGGDSNEWYARRKFSTKPRAIYQREQNAKMKSENFEAYDARNKKRNEMNRARRHSLKGEKKEHESELSKLTQRKFEERRRQQFSLPENAEKAKSFKEMRAISSKKSRNKFMDAIRSGKATKEQTALYLKQKSKKAEYARKKYYRKKAVKEALNGTENKED